MEDENVGYLAKDLFNNLAVKFSELYSGLEVPGSFEEQPPYVQNFWRLMARSITEHSSHWRMSGDGTVRLSNFERERLKKLPVIK